MRGRRRPVALGLSFAAIVVLLLLGLAQLIAPGLAENRLRHKLARNAQVISVSVSAFPAVKLLFGHADSVRVHLGRTRVGTARTGELLSLTRATGSLDVRVDEVQIGPLRFEQVALRKRAGALIATAHVTAAAIAAALPPGLSVTPIASGAGALLLRGQVSAFGLSAGADAIVAARDGALVVSPEVPFGGLLALTLFDQRGVHVDGVSAAGTTDGFDLTAYGHLT